MGVCMNAEITRYIKTASDWERRYSQIQLENDLLRSQVKNHQVYSSLLESQALIQDNAILRKDKELKDAHITLNVHKWFWIVSCTTGYIGGMFHDLLF